MGAGSALREPRRRARKLAREHGVDFRLAEPDSLGDELERGFALEASGWKGAEGTAITSAAPAHAFYSAVAAAYHERSELRLGWLHIDGHPATF